MRIGRNFVIVWEAAMGQPTIWPMVAQYEDGTVKSAINFVWSVDLEAASINLASVTFHEDEIVSFDEEGIGRIWIYTEEIEDVTPTTQIRSYSDLKGQDFSYLSS